MTLPRHLLAMVLAITLVVPVGPLFGQSVASTELSFGVDEGVGGTPFLAGLDVTLFDLVPFLSARASLDLGLTNLDADNLPPLVGGGEFRSWAADVDLLLVPDHVGWEGVSLGAFDPFLLGGAGLRNTVDETGNVGTMVTAGYGGGLSYRLHPNFRLELEARRWHAVGENELADGSEGDGWSFRIGTAINFGPHLGGDPAGSPGGDTVMARPEDDSSPGANAPKDDPGVEEDEVLGEFGRTPPWRRMDLSETRRTILEEADRYLGTPYVWGGAEPMPGFDCSGFVQHVFDSQGIRLPRPSRIMAQAGQPLPTVVDSLRPADVMFFSKTNEPDNITHVAIYAGDRTILHATGSGGGVAYDDLTTPRGQWFAERLVAASRVIGVPVMATRSVIPITPETWDPRWDGAPPKEGVEPPKDADSGG